jgi:hypothetical protein
VPAEQRTVVDNFWKPNATCPFVEEYRMRFLNMSEICEIMDGRSVFFWGDSMNVQFGHAFVEQINYAFSLTLPPEQRSNRTWKMEHVTKFYLIDLVIDSQLKTLCGKVGMPTKAFSVFVEKDWGIQPDYEPYFMKAMRQSLVESPNNYRLIAVLNSGIHPDIPDHNVKDGRVQLDLYNKTYAMFTKNFGHLFPNITVFWRTVFPGHIGCRPYANEEPLAEMPQYIVPPGVVDPNYNLFFKWDMATVKNAAMKELIYNDHPEITFLDIFSASYRRRDSKFRCASDDDCLHLHPGSAIEYWPVLFWNALRLHNQLFANN